MRELAWRLAHDADAPALVALIRSAYRGEASREGWTSEADLVEGERIDEPEVQLMIEGSASRVMVVEQDGELVACCQVERLQGDAAAFGTFAVAPRRQGGGLGRRLLGEAERVAAEELGARHLQIKVLEPQAALIAWYERLGFVRTGETARFAADPRYARVLVDDLRFVALSKELTG